MKKKTRLKIISMLLAVSMCLTMLPSFSVFAEEAPHEKLTEGSELWIPEEDKASLNTEGDLPLDVLETSVLAQEDTPEIVSQEAIEQKGHVNRLRAQEEDLNTIIFQNKDGTKTMYYFADPVKYTDKNGKVKDKKNKISEKSDNYTNEENDINTYFPKKLHKNKGVELKFGDINIEVSPIIKGTSGASRQTGHNKHGQPTDTVAYPKVFDDNISIRYTPTFDGYKEDIIINEQTEKNKFSFNVKTGGLSLISDEQGSYKLVNSLTGETTATIGELIIYDSKPILTTPQISEKPEIPTLTEEETNTLYFPTIGTTISKYNHYYEVETIKQDNEYVLTIVVDERYLDAEETIYPVTVDPSFKVEGFSTSQSPGGIQDATIYSNDRTNHGGNGILYVGNTNTTKGVARTLIKFEGLMNNATFKSLSSSRISSAKFIPLNLSPRADATWVDVYRATQSWTESTVKCNSSIWGAYGGELLDDAYVYSGNGTSYNGTYTGNWYPLDITNAVKDWKDGYYGGTGNHYGIMLKAYDESNQAVMFGSSENGGAGYDSVNKPALWVDYDTPISVSQVCVNPSSVSMNVNSTMYLSSYVSILPSNATNKNVTYSSSNTNVATVSSTGMICASSAGTTTITVRSSADSSKVATCKVTVRNTDPLHPSNITYIRYTTITSGNTNHLLTLIKSRIVSDEIFTVLNQTNGLSRDIVIDNLLKTRLSNLENGYHSHLIPATMATIEEEAAHVSKGQADKLVSAEYFTSGSGEYYGVWANNYVEILKLLNYWTSVINNATTSYMVFTTLNLYYLSHLASGISTTVNSTQYSNMYSYADDIERAMAGTNYNTKTVITAETRNSALGYANPPYKSNTPVVGYKPTQTTQYVRVYNPTASANPSNMQGGWVMRYSDIQGLTPTQIQSKFALPNPPTHICDVNIPAGTQMYSGIANAIPNWGAGGGVQFEIGRTINNGSFVNPRLLP